MSDNNASEIMQMCLEALQRQPSAIPNEYGLTQNCTQKKDLAKQLLASALNSCISPLEESQNNKIIEKLRKKNNKKKQLKEVVIRKTDLGQNQLIFTKQELEKLNQIDEDQLYGMQCPKTTQAPLQLPTENPNNILSPQPTNNKKYFVNPPNTDNPHDEILSYLNWVDTKQLKSNKDKKKSKILNFQKRQRSASNSLESFSKKLKSPFPVLMTKMGSPFRGLKSSEMGKAKSCYPLIKKNSVDKVFLKSMNANETQVKRVGEKQKLNEIIFKANQYVEKEFSSSYSDKKYIYMTDERKQALFQCEVLRRIKRDFGPKFYQRLQLSYGNNLNKQKTDQDYVEYEQENDNRSSFNNNKGSSGEGISMKKAQNKNMCGKQKNYTGQKQKLAFESQAQKMLHKNRNRLKEERKRVIQRIVC